MKKIYITFGGSAYDQQTEIVVRDAPKFGVDQVLIYDDYWLKRTEFYARNKWLWSWRESWGFGWNCWKAYIIMDAIARFPDSVVLYVDGDTYPIADLTPIYRIAALDGAAVFHEQGCLTRRFTRRDCFLAMGIDGMSADRVAAPPMVSGRYSAWRHDQGWILSEWDVYLRNATCQGWHRSDGLEFTHFQRHSGDQSILTILAWKYDLKPHREPDQGGFPPAADWGQPDDAYPQLFQHDGMRLQHTEAGSRFRNV